MAKNTDVKNSEIFHSIDSEIADRTPEEVFAFLCAVVDSTEDAIITTDLNGIITSWNDGATRLYGYSPKESIGQSLAFIYPADGDKHVSELIKKVQQVKYIKPFQSKRIDRAGIPKDVSITAALLRDASGHNFGTVTIQRGLSRIIQNEEERNLFAAIVESADDAIIGKDLDGKITSWNSGAENIYRYTKDEAIGKHISIIVPEERKEELDWIMQKLNRGEYIEPHETKRMQKDGTIIDISVSISPIRGLEGTIVGASAVARNITQRKKVEVERDWALSRERRARQVLEQRQQQLKFLVKASEILASSLDYEITLTNVAKLAVGHIADWCIVDLVEEGETVRVAVEHLNEEKKHLAAQLREQIQTLKQTPSTMQKVIDTGKPILFPKINEALVRELIEDEKYAKLLLNLGLESAMVIPMTVRGNPIGVMSLISEDKNQTYTKKDMHWAQELAHYAALAVEDSRLYSKVKSLNETLERRVEERTEELERTNRELESFSYSVSHDLRAPLRAIRGFSDLLLHEHTENLSEDGKKYLGFIDTNVRKMGHLIDDLLTYSRVSRKQVQYYELDMTKIVHEVLEDLRCNGRCPKHQIDVASLPKAQADRTLMVQVWQNLLSNAIKYTNHQEKPQIKVGSKTENGTTIYVVEDNGVGFNMKYAEKAFEVFQRLHREEDYEGTGVGLAIVKRIIDSHGGDIWAESKPGGGSKFYFSLSGGILHDD